MKRGKNRPYVFSLLTLAKLVCVLLFELFFAVRLFYLPIIMWNICWTLQHGFVCAFFLAHRLLIRARQSLSPTQVTVPKDSLLSVSSQGNPGLCLPSSTCLPQHLLLLTSLITEEKIKISALIDFSSKQKPLVTLITLSYCCCRYCYLLLLWGRAHMPQHMCGRNSVDSFVESRLSFHHYVYSRD